MSDFGMLLSGAIYKATVVASGTVPLTPVDPLRA